MKTYCFALDLQDDPELIAEYKWYHRLENIWPAVLDRIRGDGVVSEEIYQAGNRLFMILRTTDEFSLDAKAAADKESAVMQDWEQLMWKYQRALPFAPAGTKWVCLEKIFEIRTNGHDPNSGSSAKA